MALSCGRETLPDARLVLPVFGELKRDRLQPECSTQLLRRLALKTSDWVVWGRFPRIQRRFWRAANVSQ